MTHVVATANTGPFNYAMYNAGASPIMKNVTAKGLGGILSLGYGVYNSNFTSTPQIDASHIEGITNGMVFNGSTDTRITNTRIVGNSDPLDSNPAGVQCRNTYDENLADVSC